MNESQMPADGFDSPRGDEPQYGAVMNLADLSHALAKAQGEFTEIRRDKTVTVKTKAGYTYTFDYAPLETILRATKGALSKHGLALTQLVEGQNLVTKLLFGDASLENRIPIMASEGGPQAYGSALTYARRYGITLLLGVCADDDDDGNAAEGNEAHANLDRKKAKEYADRFAEAIQAGIDHAVYEIHQEINADQDLYRQTWSLLPSGMRRQLKEIIDREKKA